MAIVEIPDVNVISFTGNTRDRPRDRHAARASGSSASASSWAARTPSPSWPTRTSTSPSTASSGRRSAPPASAAPPAAGWSSTRRSPTLWSAKLVDRASKLRLGSGLEPTTDVGPLINSTAPSTRSAATSKSGHGEGGRLVAGGQRANGEQGARERPLLPADDLRRREADGPAGPGGDLRAGAVGHPRRRLRGGGDGRQLDALRPARRASSPRDTNTAFRAMRDFATGIVYVNAGTIGAETHLPFGGMKRDRQRPPRGRPRRARHVHRVEVDLRRLLGQAAARPDRQPVSVERACKRAPPEGQATDQATNSITLMVESAAGWASSSNEGEALEWIKSMKAEAKGGDIVVDVDTGVFGHRATMLDLSPERPRALPARWPRSSASRTARTSRPRWRCRARQPRAGSRRSRRTSTSSSASTSPRPPARRRCSILGDVIRERRWPRCAAQPTAWPK